MYNEKFLKFDKSEPAANIAVFITGHQDALSLFKI